MRIRDANPFTENLVLSYHSIAGLASLFTFSRRFQLGVIETLFIFKLTHFLIFKLLSYLCQCNKKPKTMENETQKPFKKDDHKNQKSHGNLVGGLVLITLGILFLIDRFVPRVDFGDLWPVILVVIGIGLIINSFYKSKTKE